MYDLRKSVEVTYGPPGWLSVPMGIDIPISADISNAS